MLSSYSLCEVFKVVDGFEVIKLFVLNSTKNKISTAQRIGNTEEKNYNPA